MFQHDNRHLGQLMGVILCKFCCCGSCCGGCWNRILGGNSVGILPEKKLKFLLLGLEGSGKTEIAHYLSRTQRLDYDPTNGVHNYNMTCMEAQCSMTEIGGNDDIQRIWHHYYAGTMAIIYCFDMSAELKDLQKSFRLLNDTMKDSYVAGKPVLLVATKADLADESIQLYDIENSFHLHQMAATYGNTIKLCVYDPRYMGEEFNNNLKSGFNWLVRYVLDNYDVIQMRLNCDKNMKNWEMNRDNMVNEGKLNFRAYQRFPKASTRHKFWRLSHKRLRRSLIRPRTAPSKLSFVSNLKTISSPAPNEVASSEISLTHYRKVPNGVLPTEIENTVV
ncbi:ADP-ribosylation factor [Haematobia irritans]|uniref:ADP-ribosylation factor n=1 Tax=Haematobia irritans TaxID=7368 RepID=UPI003F505780